MKIFLVPRPISFRGGEATPNSTKNKDVRPNNLFLNDCCWALCSGHKKARRSPCELLDKVRVNTVFSGIAGTVWGFGPLGFALDR